MQPANVADHRLVAGAMFQAGVVRSSPGMPCGVRGVRLASVLTPLSVPQLPGCGKCAFATGGALRLAPRRAAPSRVAVAAPVAELERLRLHNLSPEKGSRPAKSRKGRGHSAGQARPRPDTPPWPASGLVWAASVEAARLGGPGNVVALPCQP
jgi:hypothetical protein